ncbi:prepilin-type N-terminal cleavage/methylation domain-containing protein [Sulfurimonas aquatica]|uniref:Prepilin-type N-terminal cleavage/methylation domain-containing protein n=1 Tax=Sulfurimonas aquatica TaxID=2672570 RepID=A0A975AYN9_9BACT|nr:prepilin-type N-terminal cleavage/methylation domain-containing protein [Sulfurimonas aquatica]QSZ41027.1 prepilin-type N-terminal cleavage/methylation domain-containing protein [Sulfurimonas aquatica]
MVRFAFTLIELIFAIVVIGITVVSLPMMTQVTAKGIDENIVQEAIFAATTELTETITYRWDENSLELTDPNSLSRVINTGDCNATTKLRPGHINQPLHRRCLEDTTVTVTATANLGPDAGDSDDIDDTIHSPSSILTGTTPGTAEGYKQDYNSSISVAYADFGTTTAASQNMKKITISISDAGGLVTRLSAYSANIGEVDYYKRSY